MWQLKSTLAALPFCLSASVAIAAGPFGSIQIGSWVGGAFTDDRTGAFSDCRATSEDQDQSSITLEERSSGTIALSFSDAAWHLRVGERFPVAISFDNHANFQVSGTATADAMAKSTVPNKAFLAWFIKSHLMTVRAKGQTLHWRLTYADKLLTTIASCIAKVRSSGVAGVEEFSVSGTNTPTTSEAPVPTATVSPSPVSSQLAAPSPPRSVPVPIEPGLTVTPQPPVAALPGEPTATATITLPGSDSRPPVTASAAIEVASSTRAPSDVVGTGFVIDPAGYVITANHVVNHCRGGIQGNLSGDAAMTLQLVSADETNDLALLRASGKFKYNGMLRKSAILVGDPVLVFGYSARNLPQAGSSTAGGFVSALSGDRNDSRFLQISLATPFGGEAGGPLLDTKGNIVGLMTAVVNANRITGPSDAVPKYTVTALKSGALRNFLDSSPVAYQIADARIELDTKQIRDRAGTYTMFLTCVTNNAGNPGK